MRYDRQEDLGSKLGSWAGCGVLAGRAGSCVCEPRLAADIREFGPVRENEADNSDDAQDEAPPCASNDAASSNAPTPPHDEQGAWQVRHEYVLQPQNASLHGCTQQVDLSEVAIGRSCSGRFVLSMPAASPMAESKGAIEQAVTVRPRSGFRDIHRPDQLR